MNTIRNALKAAISQAVEACPNCADLEVKNRDLRREVGHMGRLLTERDRKIADLERRYVEIQKRCYEAEKRAKEAKKSPRPVRRGGFSDTLRQWSQQNELSKPRQEES